MLLKTVEGVIKEPPTKEEVERAKTRILKQIELGLTDSQSVGLISPSTRPRAIGACCFWTATGSRR